jgi:peptidoglycan/xylan/chitin deacetylase (PgdA/CDA1 family)
MAKRFLAPVVYYGGLTEFFSPLSKDHALVLMYHRVLDEAEVNDAVHPGMYVTRSTFELQLQYLSKRYHVVTLQDLQEWLAGKKTFPKIPCAITFDDGWEDNYHNAFPLLQTYRMPATVFLITNQMGGPGMLTWEQVREMEERGISFGSHTATHAILPTLTPTEIREELARSKEKLQKELKHPSDWFCYPKGQFSPEVCRLAREYYVAALATGGGAVSKGDDPFRIRRIGIHDDVSRTIPLLACRLGLIF